MALEFDTTTAHDISGLRRSAVAQRKFDRYLALLCPQPGERLLDLGCGSGEFTRMLAQQVGPDGHVTGVDPSVDALRLAVDLSADTTPYPITYEQGDGHALAYQPAAFDAATCISVLTFCHNPMAVVGELYRVLRPGGRLLLASSDEDSRFYNSLDRELGRRILRAIADRGIEPWSGRRLVYWIEKAGFAVVKEKIRTDLEREYREGMAGYKLAHSMQNYLINQAGISIDDYHRWLSELEICSQEGSYCYGATSYAYLAVREQQN